MRLHGARGQAAGTVGGNSCAEKPHQSRFSFALTLIRDFVGERRPPVPLRKGPGAIRAMPTTIAASPSLQGHEQRRVSSPPRAKFGRGLSHEKILTVVLAQQMGTKSAALSVLPSLPLLSVLKAPLGGAFIFLGTAAWGSEQGKRREPLAW